MKRSPAALAILAAAVLLTAAARTPAVASLEERVADLERRVEDKSAMERRDLSAQEAMASSARDLANLTVVQIWLAIVGTAGLAGTLLFTYATLADSRKSSLDQRRQAAVQLRAYLAHDGADVIVKDDHITITSYFKNFGSTPALSHYLWYTSFICEGFPEKIGAFIQKSAFKPMHNLMPGAKVAWVSDIKFDDMSKADFAARRKSHVTFEIRVFWDVFGKQHVVSRSVIRSGKNLRLHRGNYAEYVANGRAQKIVKSLRPRDLPPLPLDLVGRPSTLSTIAKIFART